MVDHGRKPPCISTVTQEVRNCFYCEDHPTEAERRSGRIRRAELLKRAARASVPSNLRRGERPISPSPRRRPSPASLPILLPRLSFGETLPDADELFSTAVGSDSLTPLPSEQHDRSTDVSDRQIRVDRYREEVIPQHLVQRQTQTTECREEDLLQHSMEDARIDASPPGSFVQPSPRQTTATAFLETCIMDMMSNTERRPDRGRRSRRLFDERKRQPIPLPTESLRGSFSALPPPRQRTGNAATPAVSPSNPETEHPEAQRRLDSADLPASETHQLSTLEPLAEELCRDSGAYIPGQPAPAAGSSDRSNAAAAPVDRPEFRGTSTIAIKDAVPTPPAIKSPSPPSPSTSQLPTSRTDGKTPGHNLPSERFPGSLRTSRAMRARPQPVNRPQQPQNPGTTDFSPSEGDILRAVDGYGSSSRTLLATSSLSPPCVPPRDPARERKD